MGDDKDTFHIGGKTASLLALIGMMVGGGSTFLATNTDEGREERAANRQAVSQLQQNVLRLNTEFDIMKGTLSVLRVTGSDEVRKSLERIEQRLERIERMNREQPKKSLLQADAGP
jgi:TolA-binding protein